MAYWAPKRVVSPTPVTRLSGSSSLLFTRSARSELLWAPVME